MLLTPDQKAFSGFLPGSFYILARPLSSYDLFVAKSKKMCGQYNKAERSLS